MAMGPILGAGRRGRRTPMAEINVTPMVDVMLVLLIIFMVTAPLLTAGVPVDLPDSKAAALDQERKPVPISLDARGQSSSTSSRCRSTTLAARLAADRRGGREPGGPRIFLRADRGLDYGRVMQVMGEINRAGLRKVALVSTQTGETPLMDRAEAAGLGVAVVGHGALLASLSVGFGHREPAPISAAPIEVSFVDEVGLNSAAPQPSTAPRRCRRWRRRSAPRRGCRAGARRRSRRRPRPGASRRPRPRPAPAPAAAAPGAAAARAGAGASGTGRTTRRPGLGDRDPRSFGRDPAARSNAPPAAVMSAQAAADIASAISRQVQPCADRQRRPGPGAERIVTAIASASTATAR